MHKVEFDENSELFCGEDGINDEKIIEFLEEWKRGTRSPLMNYDDILDVLKDEDRHIEYYID